MEELVGMYYIDFECRCKYKMTRTQKRRQARQVAGGWPGKHSEMDRLQTPTTELSEWEL